MLDGGTAQRSYKFKPQPNVTAEKSKYYRQTAVLLGDGVKGLLHVNLGEGITTFGAVYHRSLAHFKCSAVTIDKGADSKHYEQ
jgi:hypothetical protein